MARRRFGRWTLETSREDKVLFPEIGLTKGELIDYYERISRLLLPHLRDRPLVVERFPDGVGTEGFYQRRAGSHAPDWVTRAEVELRTEEGSQELVVCDKKATLAFLADQAAIALHPWLSQTDRLDHPDLLVFDLDPSEDDFRTVRDAALRVRDLCAELGLTPFPKLTGSRGVHVVVPLDRSRDFEAVRGFAREAVDWLAARHPDSLTTEARRAKRRGRLYLDVARNGYGQTAVAAWSVRPLPTAPIAAPIPWRDLERGRLGARDFTVGNVFRRIAQREDPWAGWRRHAASLGPAIEALQRLQQDRGT